MLSTESIDQNFFQYSVFLFFYMVLMTQDFFLQYFKLFFSMACTLKNYGK